MRKFLRLFCKNCSYKWIAPQIGMCPKCHYGVITVEGQDVEGAPLQ